MTADTAQNARSRAGLVSQRLIVGLGIGTIPVAIGIALLHGAGLIWLLGLVWLWLTLMTFEFGVPTWLKARPVLYLLSHMAIMPLIDLMLTGIEWLAYGKAAPGLWLFIALSFSNGCVLELGRKLWSPDSERDGVETYSGLWEPSPATAIWLCFVAISAALLVGVGAATGHLLAFTFIALTGFWTCALIGRNYVTTLTQTSEKRVDTAAGLWVFLCYATAGFLPLALGGLP